MSHDFLRSFSTSSLRKPDPPLFIRTASLPFLRTFFLSRHVGPSPPRFQKAAGASSPSPGRPCPFFIPLVPIFSSSFSLVFFFRLRSLSTIVFPPNCLPWFLVFPPSRWPSFPFRRRPPSFYQVYLPLLSCFFFLGRFYLCFFPLLGMGVLIRFSNFCDASLVLLFFSSVFPLPEYWFVLALLIFFPREFGFSLLRCLGPIYFDEESDEFCRVALSS